MKWLKRQQNQSGLASIVIVAVLVVILTLVSIGFARLMNRAITNSTDKELGTAASYAAQSGINDAIGYIQTNYNTSAPGNGVNKPNCKDILNTGGGPVQADLVTGNSNVRYTCLTINPTPIDLVFKNLPAYKSQIVKMTTDSTSGGATDKLLFSWSGSSTNNTPVPSGTNLLDETSWGTNNYVPVLRVSIYPVLSGGSLANAQSNSSTFFLYPNAGGGGTITNFAGSTSEALQSVHCGNNTTSGIFNTGADDPSTYTCSAVITVLSGNIGNSANGYYYARIMPLYSNANVRIQANDSTGKLLKFTGVQGVIDSTAVANSAIKRLQATVDLSALGGGNNDNIAPGDDNAPNFVHDTPGALCKQLDVSNATIVNDAPTFCNLGITQPPLVLGLCAVPGGAPACNPASLSGTTVSDGGTGTLYYNVSNAIPGSCVLSNAQGAFGASGGINGFGPGSGNLTTQALSSSSSPYTFTLRCNNFSNVAQSTSVQITVTPPVSSSNGGGNGGGNGSTTTTGSPGGAITVRPVCAANSPPGCSWFNSGHLGQGTTEQCHDGIHNYVICLSWNATDTYPGGVLQSCTVQGNTYGPGTPPVPYVPGVSGYDGTSGAPNPPVNNWWNVTLGYVTQPAGQINMTVTCKDQSNSGSGSICTDFDSSCQTGGGSSTGSGSGSGSSGGPGPSCPPGAGGNSCSYSQFNDCDFGDGQPGGYPDNNAGRSGCIADGGRWTTFCRSSDGAVREQSCSGANF